jgi:predicted peptidase
MGKGYYAVVRVTDFGPYVTKLILPVQGSVREGLSGGSFSVYVERRNSFGEIMLLPRNWVSRDAKEPSCGYAEVTDCYSSDFYGSRCDEGSYIALELANGPAHSITAEISAPDGFNVSVISDYRITQLKPFKTDKGTAAGLLYDRKIGTRCSDYSDFRESISHDREQPLRYGYYIPQGPSKKKPLIIWLHGGGEGGQETKIAYMGNKVTAMAASDIQQLFGGCYLFVPQCPTLWMHDGDEIYGRSGRSRYTGPLKAAIDEFLENEPGIDRKRIYIGGDSNGGYMTMRLLIDYPELFAAAFPVCEILYDENISDEQIGTLAGKPIWFVHARNDTIVDPGETTEATYLRLIAGRRIKCAFFLF